MVARGAALTALSSRFSSTRSTSCWSQRTMTRISPDATIFRSFACAIADASSMSGAQIADHGTSFSRSGIHPPSSRFTSRSVVTSVVMLRVE